jgi:uncharacterized membrane protein YecN with MAPEG domain
MTDLNIVALYVGLNAILLALLSMNVGRYRGAQQAVQPGEQGEGALTRAIRAHGNYIEYAPAVLLILLVLAALGKPPLYLHLYGGIFTAARVLHAVGMTQEKHPNPLRVVGALATMLLLLVGGVTCILAFV